MPSVIFRVTPPPSLRLWAGLLLACALALCVTGAARCAAVMSDGPMKAMHQPGQDVRTDGQDDTAVDEPGRDDPCPVGADHCAQSRAAAISAASASAHAADAPQTASVTQAEVPRSGTPPSTVCDSPPPDLRRLCVSRT